MAESIKFTLDGQEVEAQPGETIFRAARRVGVKLPHLCYTPKPGYRAGRQLPRLHGGGRGRAGAGGKLHPHADAGHEGQDPDRPGEDRAADGGRTAAHRSARDRDRARSGLRTLEDRQAAEDRARPFPARRASCARPQPSGHGGQPRRLHPMQSVRPRLPRGAGQRRDRHGGPRAQRQDRVRLRRPDGRLDLRRLRRVRAGLPDRRADALDAGQRRERPHRISRPQGRQRVPVLRRRLPAHLRDQERQADRGRPAATARRTRTGCASRAASASTTCQTRSA